MPGRRNGATILQLTKGISSHLPTPTTTWSAMLENSRILRQLRAKRGQTDLFCFLSDSSGAQVRQSGKSAGGKQSARSAKEQVELSGARK